MKASAIILAMLCAGCGHHEYVGSLSVTTDPLNGCQYVRENGRGRITPRMGADGKQICNAKEK